MKKESFFGFSDTYAILLRVRGSGWGGVLTSRKMARGKTIKNCV